MPHSKAFIDCAVALGERGLFRDFRLEDTLVRGYADLGFEEFSLLGSGQIVSLSLGKVSELPEAHRNFFYRMPRFEELIDEILRKGFDISAIDFPGQRRWRVAVRAVSDAASFEATHEELAVAVAQALLQIVSQERAG